MWTNGRGTNSNKPADRRSQCRRGASRTTTRCRAQLRGSFDGSEHDRRVGAQAETMSDAMNLAPFLCRDLVGTDDRPDLVVEDLGRGSRQRREAGFLQLDRGSPRPDTRRLSPLRNLEGGERVDVHLGDLFLDRRRYST